MKRLLSLTICITISVQIFAQILSPVQASLKKNVEVLTSDSLMGRGSGTLFESRAAKYVTGKLAEAGAEILYPGTGQDFSFISGKDTLRSGNVLAIVEGIDSVLKNEYILIAAHYDHLGRYVMKVNGRDSLVFFPGADDNASGIACMINLAKMISDNSYLFRRSVIFAAFGAEENGMKGSWYFANRAFREMPKLAYVVNLDMVGRSGGDNYLRAYTVVPNAELSSIFTMLADRTYRVYPKVFDTDYFPSDHQPFASKGIPVTLVTTGIHSDYHTLRDTPDKLDYKGMEAICEYVFDLVRAVSDRDKMLRRGVLSDDDKSIDPKNRIYSLTEVQKRAMFGNGDEKSFLENWVYKYIKYPEDALNSGLQGRCIVEFVVEKSGSVTDVQIVESAGASLDDEAVKVIKASPKWKPAKINGTPVRSRLSLPVEFRLRR